MRKQCLTKIIRKLYHAEVLDELDIIECFEQPGGRRRIGEFTKTQMDHYTDLAAGIPT
ncbi:hypothetical protein [Paenibacillus monticola]|uniref:Uncharacterized protein n=1 Tax=Paenibacillus monticola TaxID=2666075 RepID=A0A7X2L1C9_9BACL|nr:hypothetical protein [Paenibacillus monticola]MRN53033.1 hypothetical protein [Paenibacillus monticola]